MSDERLRLFCALQLPGETIDELVALAGRQSASRGGSSRRGNLHVTLAFLGSRPAGEVPAIVDELRGSVCRNRPVELGRCATARRGASG